MRSMLLFSGKLIMCLSQRWTSHGRVRKCCFIFSSLLSPEMRQYLNPYCHLSWCQGAFCFVWQIQGGSSSCLCARREVNLFLVTVYSIHNLLPPEDCGLQQHPLIKASHNYRSRIYLSSSWIAFLTGSRCHLYFIGLCWPPVHIWVCWRLLLQAWNILAAWEMLCLTGRCELKAVDVVKRRRHQGLYCAVPTLA